MSIELPDYEAGLMSSALREVYKNHGVTQWELEGGEGRTLADKIDAWANWAACERRADGIFVSQPTLCMYFSDWIQGSLKET